MTEVVLDSSALLAVLLNEAGADRVHAVLPEALLSMVNFAEVMTKLIERGMPIGEARMAVETTRVRLMDFNPAQAVEAAHLRLATRFAGLSLGDRVCLALARQQGCAVMTADRAWAKLEGFDVRLIRGADPGGEVTQS